MKQNTAAMADEHGQLARPATRGQRRYVRTLAHRAVSIFRLTGTFSAQGKPSLTFRTSCLVTMVGPPKSRRRLVSCSPHAWRN